MNQLPNWALANPFPAIHDFESLTVLDQTARLYAAMRNLIDEYNKFSEEANKNYRSFSENETEARKTFENDINKVMREFLCNINRDLKINLDSTASNILHEEMQKGNISIPTDTSLSKENFPADAKAVGEQVSLNSARIDNLTKLPDGSTAGDAELADIRIGYDGNLHETAGNAVRAQVRSVVSYIENVDRKTTVKDVVENYNYPLTVVDGECISDTGYVNRSEMFYHTKADVTPGDNLRVSGHQWDKSFNYSVCLFMDADGNVLSHHAGDTSGTFCTINVVVPDGATTIIVNGASALRGNSVIGDYTMTIGIEDIYKEITKEEEPAPKVKLITLGDSITELGTGERGWIRYFIEKTGCELIANTAVCGATMRDKSGTVYDGNPVWNGADDNVNNVLGNQVQKIINNNYEAPDIIMVAIGTNDGIYITMDQMRAVYYDSNNALIPLENVDRTTSAGAYRWCFDKLHETYPNAIIFWCAPILGYAKRGHEVMEWAESLRIATEYTGQIMIDANRCGINGFNEVSGANGQYLIDGLHPNVNGAKKIGYYNASKVMPFIGNGFELT